MTLPLGLLLASKLWNWLRHLGGPGLLLLGLADNSLIPLPGSMDVLTIWFAVHHHNQWTYYAAMATLGSVIGGYVTYRLAARAGRRRSSAGSVGVAPMRSTAGSSVGILGGRGAGSAAPPFPIVPFLLAAGAMQYSRGSFWRR